MTVREKIESGAYASSLPYPSGNSADADVRKARHAYHSDKNKLEDEFRIDLEAEFCMKEFMPRVRDKVFDMAWERGHDSGLSEVLLEYEDLIELLNLFRA
jgi:hypothetical protein